MQPHHSLTPLLLALLTLTSATSTTPPAAPLLPFHPALPTTTPQRTATANPSTRQPPPPPPTAAPALELRALRPRAPSCPLAHAGCGILGPQYAGMCCATTAACSLDAVGSIACCPLGAACTGLVAGTAAGAAATPLQGGQLVPVPVTTEGGSTPEGGGGFVVAPSVTVSFGQGLQNEARRGKGKGWVVGLGAVAAGLL